MKLVYTSVQLNAYADEENNAAAAATDDGLKETKFHIDEDDDTFFHVVEHEKWYHRRVLTCWLPPCVLVAMLAAGWWLFWWTSSRTTWHLIGGSDTLSSVLVPKDESTSAPHLSLSADGMTLALGYPHWHNDTASKDKGRVQVLQYDAASQKWLLQDDLYGNKPNDLFGYSVLLSGDGNLLAASNVGAQTIFVRSRNEDDSNNKWHDLARVEEEERLVDDGTAVALSQDGRRLVLGSAFGSVRVLEVVPNKKSWRRVGNELNSAAATRVAISSNGNRIAVASQDRVEIYELANDNTEWDMATSIDSESSSQIDYLSMSADGRRIAFSFQLEDTVVRTLVMEESSDDGGAWSMVGKAIESNNNADCFAMAFSGDGMVVVVAEASGVRVLQFKHGRWLKNGRSIGVDSGSDLSLSISSDGKRIAIAAIKQNGNDKVGVYELR